MTWEVRAVDKAGTLVSVVDGVDVGNPVDELNGRESVTLTIPTLHPDAGYLAPFSHEVQLWLDGSFYGWFVPTIDDVQVSADSDVKTVLCESLFSLFHGVFVGGQLPNHATSPHLDSATAGNPPADLTVTANVDDAAIVDNNATFWDIPKALQLNNGTAGEDAYAYERIPVTTDMVGVPCFSGAEVYIADDDGVGANPPPWGGAAYNERGLMIHRLDSTTFAPLSKPQVARITDETPRNEVVELFTPGVMPASTSEVIEIRYYSPAAWIVWRYAHLKDDRSLSADRVDKSAAVTSLVNYAQDTALGWHDYNIGTDVVSLGETITRSWPWWRRDYIGEQIEDLADTFEFTMDFPTLTAGTAVRNVKVRETIGTDLSATVTLTKADFVSWSMGSARRSTVNRIARQGGGSGAARMEWFTQDLTSLGTEVRSEVQFGAPGEQLSQLRDGANEDLARRKGKPKVIRARIVGALAISIRAGDTVAVDLDHGAAQYLGNARVMKKELDAAARAAWLDLEPV